MTQLPPDQDPSETPEQSGPSAPPVPPAPPMPPAAPPASQEAWQPPAPPTQPYTAQQAWQPPMPPQHGFQQPVPPQPVPPQPGPQVPYGAQSQYPALKPPTNVFAIIGFVGVFFLGLLGVIFGHMALSKIKRTGEGGRGLALAATIIGYVRIAGEILSVIAFLSFLGFIGTVAASQGTYGDYDSDLFSDSESSQGENYGDLDDPTFSDFPWSGTENEDFCNALLMPEVSVMDDEVVYLENLLPFTEDPELTALIEERIAYSGLPASESVEEARKRTDSLANWAQASAELSTACWGATVAP